MASIFRKPNFPFWFAAYRAAPIVSGWQLYDVARMSPHPVERKGPVELRPLLGCLLSPLGCLLGVPFLLIASVFAIPVVIVQNRFNRERDRRLLRALSAKNRVMPWSEVEGHIHAGEGTLIIEQANKSGCHFWWTQDHLAECAPMVIPTFEAIAMGYITAKSTDPFVLWLFQHYLSPTHGRACLTLPSNMDLSGLTETEYLLNCYPKARIVQTILLRSPPI